MDGVFVKLTSSLLASLFVLFGGLTQPKQKPPQQRIVKRHAARPTFNAGNEKLKNAISEMRRLDSMFIGGDHYARLEKIIAETANDPSVKREDVDLARKMLSRLNYDKGNVRDKVVFGEKRDDAKFATRDKFMHLESEVRRIIELKMAIGPGHIAQLNQQLSELSATGLFEEREIARLKQSIAAIRYFDQESGVLQYAGAENCKNINELILTHDITDFGQVRTISAPGAYGGPKDKYKGHSFINTDHKRVPVYAPVEIILESGSHYVGVEGVPQYILNFRVKGFCKVALRFDHVTEPVDSIRKVLSSAPKPFEDTTSDLVSEEFTFQAGEQIGYTTGTPWPNGAGNWDFGLYDMSKLGPLGGMGAYGQHAYAVCSWDFYAPNKKAYYKTIMDGAKFVCDY